MDGPLETAERNPLEERPLVLLMDGQTTLWEAAQTYLPSHALQILDLLHLDWAL